MDRESRFVNAATEQAIKERLDAKRQAEWAQVQQANEGNVAQRALVGTCLDMCPGELASALAMGFAGLTEGEEYEREKRQRESAVDAFEKDPVTGRIDILKAVKSYMRPSQQDIVPSDLRPPPVLKRTLDYLLHDVLPSAPFAKTLSFIWDRVRSIRQDLTIQNSRGPDAIEILERLARYYIIAVHEMRGDAAFPAKMTNDQLNGTLKSLSEMYGEARRRGEVPSPNQAEFYSYYLVFAYDASTLYQIDQLPVSLLEDPYLTTALRICALMERNNRKMGAHIGRNTELGLNAFSRFFKRIAGDQTSYLLACVFETHFADVRLGGLVTLNRAFHIRTEMPLVELAQILGCDDDVHCAVICRDYNVPLMEDGEVPVAAVLHSKYTGMDEHTKKLLPYGTPSRRLIDHKRRGATFTDLCDGKTGRAPPTPVAAPVTRMIPQTPTPTRPLVGFPFSRGSLPTSTAVGMEPADATVPTDTSLIAPVATEPEASKSSEPPAPVSWVPIPATSFSPRTTLGKPPVPSVASITPPRDLVLGVIEPPRQTAVASPSLPTAVTKPTPNKTSSTSPKLGKRKASAVTSSSPEGRRGVPVPAAVLRGQRLDAYSLPLAEKILKVALEQLVEEVAVTCQLDQSARIMLLQKDYREGIIGACAETLCQHLLADAISETAASSLVARRLVSDTLRSWRMAYERACEEHDRRETREDSFVQAAKELGHRGLIRSSTIEHDVEDLLRLGNLGIGVDSAVSERHRPLDVLICEEEREDSAQLWQRGTLLQPLLSIADEKGPTDRWSILVVTQDSKSITADWWTCKLDLFAGETSSDIPPLSIRIADKSQLDKMVRLGYVTECCGNIVQTPDAFEHVRIVYFDIPATDDLSILESRKLVDDVASNLKSDCLFRPELIVVLWSDIECSEEKLTELLIPEESRMSFARCIVTSAAAGTNVDQEVVTATQYLCTNPTQRNLRLRDKYSNDLVARLLKRWVAGFRRGLTLPSPTTNEAHLGSLLSAYQGLLADCLRDFRSLGEGTVLDMPTLTVANTLRQTLIEAIGCLQYGDFAGLEESLYSSPPIDDVTLALSYLEHLAASVTRQMQEGIQSSVDLENNEGLGERLEQGLQEINTSLATGARPRTPPRTLHRGKRPIESPLSKQEKLAMKKKREAVESSPQSNVFNLQNVVQAAKTLLQSGRIMAR